MQNAIIVAQEVLDEETNQIGEMFSEDTFMNMSAIVNISQDHYLALFSNDKDEFLIHVEDYVDTTQQTFILLDDVDNIEEDLLPELSVFLPWILKTIKEPSKGLSDSINLMISDLKENGYDEYDSRHNITFEGIE